METIADIKLAKVELNWSQVLVLKKELSYNK